MRLYVAGKSTPEETERCAAFMDRLRKLGHAITYDWTLDVLSHATAPFNAAQLKACAALDVEAVRKADATIVLYHPALRGGLVEVGVCLGAMSPCLVIGAPPTETCVFFRLCEHVDTEDQAVAFLPKLQALAMGR